MAVRKIIEIDEELCNGCGNCIIDCAEGALEIIDGKARLVGEIFCDGLGACLGNCPTGALELIERECEEFDEEAVEKRLKDLDVQPVEQEDCTPKGSGCGCMGAGMQVLKPMNKLDHVKPGQGFSGASALGHWPVQIHLVNPDMPFLKGASLLVAADCVPVAYAGFHQEFLKDRAVMIGCPKFDDAESYIQKFTEVFKRSGVKDVTLVRMEVPCCSGLTYILRKAYERAGATIPLKEVVITVQGEIRQV